MYKQTKKKAKVIFFLIEVKMAVTYPKGGGNGREHKEIKHGLLEWCQYSFFFFFDMGVSRYECLFVKIY